MGNMTEDAAMQDSLTSPYFSFGAFSANTEPDNEAQVFALRYQVYCLERLFLPAENYPDGLEKDEYDAYATHIIAHNLSRVLVGSLRLVSPPADNRFPFQQHCTQLFPDRMKLPHHECAEISRLVISKLYRRRANDTVFGVASQLVADNPTAQDIYDRRKEKREDSDRRKLQPVILLGLLRQMYQHSKRQGIRYWYMALEKPLARLLHRLFYFALIPIGKQADYYGPVTPCSLSVAYFEEALSQGDPVLFAWFQESIGEATDLAATVPLAETIPLRKPDTDSIN